MKQIQQKSHCQKEAQPPTHTDARQKKCPSWAIKTSYKQVALRWWHRYPEPVLCAVVEQRVVSEDGQRRPISQWEASRCTARPKRPNSTRVRANSSSSSQKTCTNKFHVWLKMKCRGGLSSGSEFKNPTMFSLQPRTLPADSNCQQARCFGWNENMVTILLSEPGFYHLCWNVKSCFCDPTVAVIFSLWSMPDLPDVLTFDLL